MYSVVWRKFTDGWQGWCVAGPGGVHLFRAVSREVAVQTVQELIEYRRVHP